MTKSLVKQSSDRLLFLRLKIKDQAAFIQAYEAHQADIYRFIYFKVNSEAEAQDLTSTVFLKVWSVVQAGKLKGYNTLKSLLYTVARHTVIDFYRDNSKLNKVSLDNQDEPLDIDEQNRVSEFLLVPFFGACIHVPPPPSNQIVHVRSELGVMLNDLYQPFWIEGALSVESIDSELAQAGYQMHAEKIYPYEL